MNIQIKPNEDKLARLLEQDPGHFEPTTAFRVAQHLSSGTELDVGPHTGIQPAPLAVSGFRRKLQGNVVKSAFAPLVEPLGALPPEYNELLLREERRRSRALISFLNLFAIRFSELFVAACEKYRLARRLRWSATKEQNTFRKVLLSLTGFGTAGLVEKAGVRKMSSCDIPVFLPTVPAMSPVFEPCWRNLPAWQWRLSSFVRAGSPFHPPS